MSDAKKTQLIIEFSTARITLEAEEMSHLELESRLEEIKQDGHVETTEFGYDYYPPQALRRIRVRRSKQ